MLVEAVVQEAAEGRFLGTSIRYYSLVWVGLEKLTMESKRGDESNQWTYEWLEMFLLQERVSIQLESTNLSLTRAARFGISPFQPSLKLSRLKSP